MRQRIALTTAALALTLAGSLAWAAPPKGPGQHGPGPFDLARIARFLELDETQRDAARDLLAQLRDDLAPLRDTGRQLREQLRTQLDADADAETVGTTMLALHANREQMRTRFQAFEDDFTALLTADQVELWEALKRLRRPGGPHGGPGDEGGPDEEAQHGGGFAPFG